MIIGDDDARVEQPFSQVGRHKVTLDVVVVIGRLLELGGP